MLLEYGFVSPLSRGRADTLSSVSPPWTLATSGICPRWFFMGWARSVRPPAWGRYWVDCR